MTALYVSLLVGVFLAGCVLGHLWAYRSFRNAFKLGVKDTLAEKNPEELRVFQEVLDELRVSKHSKKW